MQGDDGRDSFRFLDEYCRGKLKEWLAVESAKVHYISSFLIPLTATHSIRLFTLNYDESVETALSHQRHAVNEKWTAGFDEHGWSPDLLDSTRFEIYLYKLHGSLDWVDDEKLGKCSVRWPPAVESEEIPQGADSLLILGADAKLQAVDPFLTLLYRFKTVIGSCQLLIIVGYSFGDRHINAMIIEALQRDPTMHCIVVNKCMTSGEALPSEFKRMVDIEKRFHFIGRQAKVAFESGEIVQVINSTVQTVEEPF